MLCSWDRQKEQGILLQFNSINECFMYNYKCIKRISIFFIYNWEKVIPLLYNPAMVGFIQVKSQYYSQSWTGAYIFLRIFQETAICIYQNNMYYEND